MKYNVIIIIFILLTTTTTVFFQQSEAQRIPGRPPPPVSPRICDESTFVTIDKGSFGWSHAINPSEKISFYRGNEPWSFEIGTAFNYIETPVDLYDLATKVLIDIPQDNIYELNASQLIRDLPAIGYNYEYSNGSNTIYGTAVFAIDDQIPLVPEDENPTPQSAAFIFVYQGDSSYYNRYYSQIERMLNSFSSNNGQC